MADTDQYWLKRIAEDPRTKQGLPPTIGASQEEKDAYEAYIRMPLIESGELSTADLPESYGGRPKGTSRRAMRMQFEWDQMQKQQLQNQLMMQQMEESSARMEEFELEKEAQELEKARQAKVRDEARMIFESIRGGVQTGKDEYGNPTFSDPINPSGENALFQISNLMGLQHGMENPAARQAVMRLYEDALRSEETRRTQATKEVEQERSWLVGQQEEASALGVDTAQFFKTDPETGIVTDVDQLGLSKAIGEAKKNDLENKKRELAKSELNEELKDQARSVLDEINKTDAEIRKANFSAGREKNATKRDEFIANAEFYRSERDVLVERFNSLMPQKPTEGTARPQSFNSVEEAQSANLPKGTIVVIGGRRARID